MVRLLQYNDKKIIKEFWFMHRASPKIATGLSVMALLLTSCVSSALGIATPVPTAMVEPATATPMIVPTAIAEPTVVPTVTPITMPEDLTVVPLVRGQVTGRPFAMMIDNHPDAYPQSGLNRASIVFEALAEYGITRYLAIYPPELAMDNRQIGPIRSARHYFVQWAMGTGAIYGHAGGSPAGLELAESTTEIINLDALRDDTSVYFYRVETAERFAPHNLYTNGAIMRQYAETEKLTPTRTDVGYQYALPLPQEQRGPNASIDYFFLYDDQPVGWTYDAATNLYARTRYGKPTVDDVTQMQLTTQNVVIIQVIEAPIEGDPKARIDQQVIGSGKGVFFHDGLRVDITWEKKTAEAPLLFYTADGAEVQFTAGQIWISAVPDLANISQS